MATVKRFNWPIWAGLLLSVITFLSWPFLFVRMPATRNVPWANVLLLLASVALIVTGLRRAFAPGDRRKRLARLQDRCAARQVVADEPLRGPSPIRVDERVARLIGTHRGGLREGVAAVCGVRQELRAASRGGQIG